MKQFKQLLIETQYIPPAEYFALMWHAEEVLLEKQEHYVKGSLRNRTYIAGANGPLRLSVPLKQGKNEQMPITEVEISYREDWVNRHWRSILSAYGKSPFFIHYRDPVRKLLYSKPGQLWTLNLAFIRFFRKQFGIGSPLQQTGRYRHDTYEWIDLREALHPKKSNRIELRLPSYGQVFKEKFGFQSMLGALDLLFCTGPEAASFLQRAEIKWTDSPGRD